MALETKFKFKDELNIVFSNINSPKHILHLYSPRMDKYRIYSSFFSDVETAYVSTEAPSLLAGRFNPENKLTVIQPYQMDSIKDYDKVLVDATSIKPQPMQQKKALRQRKSIGLSVLESDYMDVLKREAYLNKLSKGKSILCAYDTSKIDPDILNKLVAIHDKLILSSPVEALQNNKSSPIEASQDNNSHSLEDFKSEKIGEFAKNELEPIVLALAMQRPICGRDIKEIVYKKFNILLSSGTLYPLLQNLEKQGLLQSKLGFKTKTYHPVDTERIAKIVEEHVQAKNFLNGFLKITVNGGASGTKIK